MLSFLVHTAGDQTFSLGSFILTILYGHVSVAGEVHLSVRIDLFFPCRPSVLHDMTHCLEFDINSRSSANSRAPIIGYVLFAEGDSHNLLADIIRFGRFLGRLLEICAQKVL